MSDWRDAVEQLRVALAGLRPHLRPYLNGAIWVLLVLFVALDIYRFQVGRPRPLWIASIFYGLCFAYLLADHLLERKLRRKQQSDKRSEDEN